MKNWKKKSALWRTVFDLSANSSAKTYSKSSEKAHFGEIEIFKKEIAEIKEFESFALQDEEIKKELSEKISNFKKRIEGWKIKNAFNGRYDKENAIFSIYAGTGGRDAEDWTSILLRMYKRYFENKNFVAKEIQRTMGEGGVKSVTLEVKGENVFGWIKSESGVHRLVRISPFSSKKLRHTSFSLVEVLPALKSRGMDVKEEDLRIDTYRASGPGGQYVNRRESAIRITHIPTKIVVTCQSERLQGENKKKALMVLQSRLVQLKEKEKEKNIQKEKGDLPIADWGNQIRSYVFQPYQMVKDHRTGVKISNLKEVLDGGIDKFIEAEHRK